MAGRPKQLRNIIQAPTLKGFKPYGQSSDKNQEPVFLLYEEYEALRLCDYEGLNHVEAAELMQVSRSTFTRVYQSVRQKISVAFVEGRPMTIQGGQVCYDQQWKPCSHCGGFYEIAQDDVQNLCPLCSRSQDLTIVIASQGCHLEDKIDVFFARAAYFVTYNTQRQNLTYLPNPYRYGDKNVGQNVSDFLRQCHADMVIGQNFGKVMQSLINALSIKMLVFKKDTTIQNLIHILKNNNNGL